MIDKPGDCAGEDPAAVAIAYHDRTKHHFRRYARSPGYMDWATQPDPFRCYEGAPHVALLRPDCSELPTYDSLFEAGPAASQPVRHGTVSRFFYEGMAISAWKQVAGGEPWSLRINPSSGDLHPTEAYLLAGAIEGVHHGPAVYHYCVYNHALERRATLTDADWACIASQLPPGSFLIALASIYWRESWKYGERAFRYCQHDVGHAIGAIAFSAATLDWQVRMVTAVADTELAVMIGVHGHSGPEAEHPDCLLAVIPSPARLSSSDVAVKLPAPLRERLQAASWQGAPNRLSREHHPWPVIDAVAAACRYRGEPPDGGVSPGPALRQSFLLNDRRVPACRIIRRRRSAVSMDGLTAISRDIFYRMMLDITPCFAPFPFATLPWRPRISIALFVHRVEGIEPGLYLLVREPAHEDGLRRALRPAFAWERPAACPQGLGLYRLYAGDGRQAAQAISCHQEIASDGAFSLGMLALFESTLREAGGWMYPRLFWESGLIGQVLYLEAEAAGVRATGIGCFFDDPMHDILGISDHGWQSLYHFTAGGAVEDSRLITLPPYAHLQSGR